MLWYASHSIAEYSKLGRFINEGMLIVTYLTVKGYNITLPMIAVSYFVLMLLFVLGGKFLVWSGVVAYNQSLTSQVNPQIMEILERLERIEKKLPLI